MVYGMGMNHERRNKLDQLKRPEQQSRKKRGTGLCRGCAQPRPFTDLGREGRCSRCWRRAERLEEARARREEKASLDLLAGMDHVLVYAERRKQARREMAERFAGADLNRRSLIAELAGVDEDVAAEHGF